MLRIGFLPSDFHPMVLMLGEAEDLRLLAGTLRRFAREKEDTKVDSLGFVAARTRLTLTGGPGPRGIQAAEGGLVWRVDDGAALVFADQVDDLAAPSRLAGSEVLTCATADEIPVKVSRGEYTDDFLTR
jgi:hypothetical protein